MEGFYRQKGSGTRKLKEEIISGRDTFLLEKVRVGGGLDRKITSLSRKFQIIKISLLRLKLKLG